MAETFLNNLSQNISAFSAGIEPGKLNPLVIESMNNKGYDISQNKVKSVDIMLSKKIKFDCIIFVCSEVESEHCPSIQNNVRKIFWSISDPSALKGTRDSKLKKIDEIRDEIELKANDFISNFKL